MMDCKKGGREENEIQNIFFKKQSYFSTCTSQGIPRHSKISNVLEPMLLETAMEPLPLRETIRLEMTSGIEVPTARKLERKKSRRVSKSGSSYDRVGCVPQSHDGIRDAERESDDGDHPGDEVGDDADPGHAHEEGQREKPDPFLAQPDVWDRQEKQEVDWEEQDPPDVAFKKQRRRNKHFNLTFYYQQQPLSISPDF